MRFLFGNFDLNIMGNNINQNGIVFKPELEVITQFWINMEIKLNKIGVTSRGGVDPERR